MMNNPLARALAIAIAVLLMVPALALADSPVGKWSGSARGAGRKASASATFRADGSCSLTASGVTASGSWSGGNLTVSALGRSATLSYSCSGDSLTISGTYMGKKGSMSLSRKSGSSDSSDSGSSKPKGAPLYGEWKLIGVGKAQTLRLYESGWLYWREDHNPPRPSEGGDTIPLAEFAAAMSVSDGKLTLTPIEGVEMPQTWQNIWGDEEGACAMPYAISGDELTFSGNDSQITFIAETEVKLDKKPSEHILLPQITLERGDTGEAVRMLQQWLIDIGYLDDKADGQYGPKTQAALRAYQVAAGDEETGIASGEMLSTLAAKPNP